MAHLRTPAGFTLAGVFAGLLVFGCSKNSGTASDGAVNDGVTAPAAKVVGPAGGTVAITNGGASVTIPPDALDKDTKITIDPIVPTPPGTIGQAFEIGPTGTVFKKPATINLSYKGADLGERSPGLLRVAVQQSSTDWVSLAATALDPNSQTVSGQTTHLSPYGIRIFEQQQTDAALDRSAAVDKGAGPEAGPDKGGKTDTGAGPVVLCPASPWGLTVDSTSVYWTDRNPPAIWKVSIGGGTPVKVASLAALPRGLAMDAQNVYVASDGQIVKLAKTGGTPVPLISDTNEIPQPDSIAVDASDVYWTNFAPGTTLGVVNKVPIAGGAAVALCTSGDACNLNGMGGGGGGGGQGIAVDATHVYWVDLYASVNRVSVNGGAAETLVTGVEGGGVHMIAIDGNNVYWTAAALLPFGSVDMIPKAGGSMTTLAYSQSQPYDLVVDGGYVYWINSDVGGNPGVMKVATTGGTPVVLAFLTNFYPPGPGHLAVDASSVYFHFGPDPNIMKVPK